jgi:ribosomal protein S18 acetylase RimI-like enzyme
MLKIREMTSEDVLLLQNFAPPEWNVDLSKVFGTHFGQPYFRPIIAELDRLAVGCANALVQGNVGWLGNIIVLPEFRGYGIGTQLTEELIRMLRLERVEHQVLVATSMGEPIYKKLGFQDTSNYIFFARPDEPGATDQVAGTRAFSAADEPELFALDRLVTGEGRESFLRPYLHGARVHADAGDRLDGYYLPELGAGLLIAANDDAGLALLRHRIRQPEKVAVVPERNRAAIDFLQSNGYVETSRAPRMALGADVQWQPEHVYCRGSGFCG